jgi:hypothetical protein
MSFILFLPLFAFQDPFQDEVARCLADFNINLPLDDSLGRSTSVHDLSKCLAALGNGAIPAIAQRLADELCKGRYSEAAMGLFGAIRDHPEAGDPLRAALSASSTTLDARIELARVLGGLQDHTSWRNSLLDIVRNDRIPMDKRLRTAEVFIPPDEDDDLREALQSIVEQLPGFAASDQGAVISVLSGHVKWMRELNVRVIGDQRIQSWLRLFSIKSALLAGDGMHYPAMFKVIDEIRAEHGEAAREAEELSNKLSDQRPADGRAEKGRSSEIPDIASPESARTPSEHEKQERPGISNSRMCLLLLGAGAIGLIALACLLRKRSTSR